MYMQVTQKMSEVLSINFFFAAFQSELSSSVTKTINFILRAFILMEFKKTDFLYYKYKKLLGNHACIHLKPMGYTFERIDISLVGRVHAKYDRDKRFIHFKLLIGH